MDTTTSLKMSTLETQSLFSAVEKEDMAAIRAHLDKFKEVDRRNESGQTALMLAAEQGSLEIVQELIRRGANINLDDVSGQTALMLAAEQGRLEIVQELISRGANINLDDVSSIPRQRVIDALYEAAMNRVKEKLKSAEQKRKVFKQQQCIFMNALERSREQAMDKAKPVCSTAQVQWYMEDHCSNRTDQYIYALFLEIIEDLMEVMDILEGLGSTGSIMENCRILLSPTTDISNLRARLPHDEVNRLSCVEARSYYGGVVSLIPVAIDLLREVASNRSLRKKPEKTEVLPKPQPKETVPQQATDSFVEDQSPSQSGQSQTKNPYKEIASKPVRKASGRPKV